MALQRQQELGGHGLQLHDFNAQSPRNHQSPRSPLGSSPLGSSPLGSPQKSHKCQHCYKAFPSTQQLGQHSLVHSNVRKYACLYCDKTFKQLSHLQQHHRRHTGAWVQFMSLKWYCETEICFLYDHLQDWWHHKFSDLPTIREINFLQIKKLSGNFGKAT